jgi:hypothetical protein
VNALTTNERFQFGLRSLLLYTFGMAALVSLFACENPFAMFAAWLLLILFFRLMRCKEPITILIFGVVWILPLFVLDGPTAAETFFKLGCRVGGIVAFIAFHVLLFVR